MGTPATEVVTPADAAADATAAAAAADAGAAEGAKAKMGFKQKVGAEIPPEMKAQLDATVARIKGIEADAVKLDESKEASPTATGKKPVTPAPAPVEKKPEEKPPETPVVATPQQIIETSKAQAREAHKLRERAQALAPREKRVEEFEKALPLLKTDPEAFVAAVGSLVGGVSWADVVRAAAAKRSGKPVPPPSADVAVKALEARQDALEKSEKERTEAAAKAKDEADIRAYKGVIAQAVTAAGDELELVAKEGKAAIDAIFFLQDLHFKENGAPLDIKIAALQIEAELEKRYAPIAAAKKFQKTVAPVAPAAEKSAAPKAPSAPAPGQKASPTLTSQHVPTTAAAQPADPPENETDDERLRRIASKHMPKLFPGQQP